MRGYGAARPLLTSERERERRADELPDVLAHYAMSPGAPEGVKMVTFLQLP